MRELRKLELALAILLLILVCLLAKPIEAQAICTQLEKSRIEQTLLSSIQENLYAGIKINAVLDFVKSEGVEGAYEPDLEVIVCDQESACIHEVGHWVDDQLDNISLTKDFENTVEEFLKECNSTGDSGEENPYCSLVNFPGIHGNELLDTNWGGYTEAYAQIYSLNHYDGWELPEVFVEFYNN